MMLDDLVARLDRFAAGALTLEELRVSFLPALESDPLDVSECDSTPWDTAPDDARCYWRLLHLFDTAEGPDDEAALRRLAARLVHSVREAGSATTLELLPLLTDQDRFCLIVRKHAAGIISRSTPMRRPLRSPHALPCDERADLKGRDSSQDLQLTESQDH